MADQVTTTGTTGTTTSATTDDSSDLTAEINAKLDEVRELMIESGMSADTADAALFSARPNTPVIVGNFADLNRLGAIVVTGAYPTPVGTPDVETTNTDDAFVEPPFVGPNDVLINAMPPDHPVAIATADAVETKIDGRGPGGVPNPASGAARASTSSTSSDLSSMSKQQLLDEADRRGVIGVSESNTKAEILAALGG